SSWRPWRLGGSNHEARPRVSRDRESSGAREPLRRRKPPWIRKRRSRSPAMSPATYLVFGDLHGRVLPAFRLAQAWARERGGALDGLLQVGDRGYYPDEGRFDKATRKYAARDALESGARLVIEPSEEADAVFADGPDPGTMWFTAGNHEDYEALKA